MLLYIMGNYFLEIQYKCCMSFVLLMDKYYIYIYNIYIEYYSVVLLHIFTLLIITYFGKDFFDII